MSFVTLETFFGLYEVSQSEVTKRMFSGLRSVWVSLHSCRNLTA